MGAYVEANKTTYPSVRANAANRVDIVDIAKGIAILLMVFGHTEQGGMHRGWWNSMPRFTADIQFADAFIYSFHMATFFFVAGLFVTHSVVRRGRSAFLVEKVKTILYPYLLWGVLIGLTVPFTQQLRATAPVFSWGNFFEGILTGNASWFLLTLFICQMFVLAVYRLPHWTQMLVALIACYLIPQTSVTVLFSPFLYFPFVVAGMWLGSGRLSRITNLHRWQAALGFLVLFAVQLAIIWLTGPVSRWDRFPIGLCGIAMLLFLSHAISQTLVSRILIWFGEASLAVFIFSGLFQGFFREVLLRVFHTTSPLPQLFLASLLTPIVPALLWYYQKQLHIVWCFRWPSGKKSAVSKPKTQTETP